MIWFIKYLIITASVIWVLVLMSCKHTESTFIYDKPFVHSCPEYGHGDCPICCDPHKNKNEETIALDR